MMLLLMASSDFPWTPWISFNGISLICCDACNFPSTFLVRFTGANSPHGIIPVCNNLFFIEAEVNSPYPYLISSSRSYKP